MVAYILDAQELEAHAEGPDEVARYCTGMLGHPEHSVLECVGVELSQPCELFVVLHDEPEDFIGVLGHTGIRESVPRVAARLMSNIPYVWQSRRLSSSRAGRDKFGRFSFDGSWGENELRMVLRCKYTKFYLDFV